MKVSAWPHRVAIALVCATFPMIWVGGLVTTYRAGMAVPDWPTTYGYNIFLYPWQTWVHGPWNLFIEHGHRLLGTLVGMISIALVGVTWLSSARRSVRWLSVLALVLVIFQGVLGGMRVLFDEVQLAKLHGCIAPAFFALSVAIALLTSRWWQSAPLGPTQPSVALGRLALLTTMLAYVQLVLGAHLRHVALGTSPGQFRLVVFAHVVLAFGLLVSAALLAKRAVAYTERPLVLPAMILIALVAAQLALGGGAWVSRFGWPAWLANAGWNADYVVAAEGRSQALVRTGHVAVGSLILAMSLVVTLMAFRTRRSVADVASNRPNYLPQPGAAALT